MKSKIIRPIQPFFVIASSEYLKVNSRQPGIAHFYKFRSTPEAGPFLAVPDGAIDVIFRCDPDHPWASVCGTVDHVMAAAFENAGTYFGVRLLPGFFDRIGHVPVEELMQDPQPLQDVLGNSDLPEQILRQKNFTDQIRIFEQAFRPNIHEETNAGHTITAAVLQSIYDTAGNIRIGELAEQLHYSRRHLSRCFEHSTGMDIKSFTSYIRFQSLLRRMNDGEFSSIADAAMAGQFYDQTHFQKVFRRYAGITPGAYLQLLRSVNYSEKLTILHP